MYDAIKTSGTLSMLYVVETLPSRYKSQCFPGFTPFISHIDLEEQLCAASQPLLVDLVSLAPTRSAGALQLPLKHGNAQK